jgi:uncharacterized glyoxalase superfamily protein PhnB
MDVDAFLPWAEGRQGRWELRDGRPVLMSPERGLRVNMPLAALSAKHFMCVFMENHPHRLGGLMRPNLSMPEAAIIPVLEYPDVPAAVKWLEEAFGFEVRLRIGAHRAQLQFESGAIVVSGSDSPGAAPGSGHSVMVRVEAIDAHLSRARGHGARIVRNLEDFPYGERHYSCLDPAGHSWTFSETIANVDPEEWGGELVSNRSS